MKLFVFSNLMLIFISTYVCKVEDLHFVFDIGHRIGIEFYKLLEFQDLEAGKYLAIKFKELYFT